MPLRIEDYAVIGNCETVALVGRDGSIDWLCLPRFDSAACFSALLGGPEHGRWLIAPTQNEVQITRRYVGDTLILETLFTTAEGSVSLTDFMYRRNGSSEVVRIVRGVQGEVAMRIELVVRFDYGAVVPWVSQQDDGRLLFIAGPDRVLLDSSIKTHGEDLRTVGDFTIREGEEASFVLNWSPSFRAAPPPLSGEELAEARKQVHSFWTGWPAAFELPERWGDAVLRSLLTLKALAHWETGGIVAAGTTSLPEKLGRPAQLGLSILLAARRDLHPLCADRRRLPRRSERRGTNGSCGPWPDRRTICRSSTAWRASDGWRNTKFRGFRATKARLRSELAMAPSTSSSSTSMAKCSTPFTSRAARVSPPATRPGRWNAGSSRISRQSGGSRTRASGKCEAARATSRIRRSWRGSPSTARCARLRNSGSMDRSSAGGRSGPQIHQEVCEHGFDPKLNSFVQSFGEARLDASLLLIPIVGFFAA